MNVQNMSKKSLRNIYSLGFVSFFTDLSSEMVLSLLPTFIINLPGSNPALLGLIEGVAEALSFGMRAISGFFSDKLGKRKSLVLKLISLVLKKQTLLMVWKMLSLNLKREVIKK